MTKIMIRVIVIALILMLFGFNGAASTLLGGMLSVVKWIFIIGGIAFVIFIIFGFFQKRK
jgi:hypothetical protein